MTHELGTVAVPEGQRLSSRRSAEIVEDMRNGRMVILVDAEDRENEGDLVIPAQMATPDAINFMAKHGRGLICLSLTQARAAASFGLEFMVAHERAAQSHRLHAVDRGARGHLDRHLGPRPRPHHRHRHRSDQGTQPTSSRPATSSRSSRATAASSIRAGHTEASVDLARLAGLYPAAVICEIMNDDGTMARMPDLVAVRAAPRPQDRHHRGSDRLSPANDRIVKRVAKTTVDSVFGGAFDLHVYETTVEPVEHLALVKGDLSEPGPVLVRVHAVNVLGDLLGIGEAGESGRQSNSPCGRSRRKGAASSC